MLYEKNQTEHLSPELFQNPTSEYRGTPFWAWNCKLDQARLNRQIEYLKEMGFGGFHMHSRTGMATPYLSDAFMDLIKGCADKAEAEGMLAWLYDEDRWPSGAAGGIVTKNPAYRQRGMLFTVTPRDPEDSGSPQFLACFDVELNAAGALGAYRQIDPAAETRGTKWYAYMITAPNSPWYNDQTYVDTLNPEAIREFIQVTYARYQEAVGERFGKSVPAIFTDEPQYFRKETLGFPQDTNDVILPWAPDLPETFREAYGAELIPSLPELFWDLPQGAVSQTRYRYHDHVTQRFTQSFAAQCGAWCREHGLALTGHMMQEPTLESQTGSIGEAMRAYPHFQIPGIDMLCNYVELTTAKQAQSVTRQSGREAMLSELYGVTHWDFDFRGHKFQGDWQAALGVTVRVPHLAWVSMAGEAKRDYPASINYQSPWYREYRYVEDHFARLNTVLTRGKPLVRVGVIHPIESYWLHWGPAFTTAAARDQMDQRFLNLTWWLLTGCVDFDFLCESILPEQCPQASAPLRVGEMTYDAVIVPGCETLRRTTLERLAAFQAQGGRLIFLGEAPRYLDALPSPEPAALYAQAERIPFERNAILEAMEPLRALDIRTASGQRTNDLLCQLRQDKHCRWLFVAHAAQPENKDIAAEQGRPLRITLRGRWRPELYDTIQGGHRPLPYEIVQGNTILETVLYDCESLLLCLTETEDETGWRPEPVPRKLLWETVLRGKVDYTLSEPNVLLLDTAEFSLDGGPFQPEEEILRLDNLCRKQLGWPLRQDHVTQPWVIPEEPVSHRITLRFTIDSALKLAGTELALEGAEQASLTLNGQAFPVAITGYYADEDIPTLAMPPLRAGRNVLTVELPLGRRTNTEWCFLLGNFHAAVEGTEKRLLPPANRIGFADVTRQGLPFYGGNIRYAFQAELPAGDLQIHVGQYRGAMIRAEVDGKDCGVIAYPPYDLTVENLAAGTHSIVLTLYGNRFNTFGTLHDASNSDWAGPPLWRTEGDEWTYSYRLRELGILSGPTLRVFQRV